MPRKRTNDKHLPERVYRKHNAFYYVDKDNKWHRLGKTLPDAMAAWALIVDIPSECHSMEALFNRYMTEVAPLKSKASYNHNIYQVKTLRQVFGHLRPNQITPVHVYRFLDLRGKHSAASANKEKELLSHVFTMAIRWGITATNPCKEVKKLPVKKHDRYINDAEFMAVRKIAHKFMKAMMDFAYLTGLRRGDIISVKISDLTEEGIQVTTNKTSTKLLITWTEDLIKTVDEIRHLQGYKPGETLFRTRQGSPCTARGISSIWQRLINKALNLNVINDKFTFHDIRRKSASDAEKHLGREYARQLLGHTDQKMTARYISGEQRVQALSFVKLTAEN